MDHRQTDERLYELYPSLRITDAAAGPHNDNRREILKLAPKKGIGVELGVFTGGFSRILLEELAPSMLHLVDPYWTAFGDFYPDWGAYTDHGKLSTHAAAKAVELRCKSALKGPASVRLHVEGSLSWLDKQHDESLDWAYLDTTHKFEDTLAELRILARKVKPPGLIMGDDFWIDPKSVHYGVVRAVHAFIREAPYQLIRADKYAQYALRREPA